MGKIQGASKEENMVIIKTTSVTLIAMHITPGTPIENIIETISKATEETRKEKNVILVGDFNCQSTNPTRRRTSSEKPWKRKALGW
jgi:endonuclease/exonuclease/phosphatase family metal-dependent hydrolase